MLRKKKDPSTDPKTVLTNHLHFYIDSFDKANLSNLNKIVETANLYKVKNDQINWKGFLEGFDGERKNTPPFDEKGRFNSDYDFPVQGERGKLIRLKNAIRILIGNDFPLTDQEKVLLYCINFSAGANIAINYALSSPRDPSKEQIQVNATMSAMLEGACQYYTLQKILSNMDFTEIKHSSPAKRLEVTIQQLSKAADDLSKDHKALEEIAAKSKFDADIAAEIGKLAAYKQGIIEKEEERLTTEMTKVRGSNVPKEISTLLDQVHTQEEKKKDPLAEGRNIKLEEFKKTHKKYFFADQVHQLLSNFKENHDLITLSQLVQSTCDAESQRKGTGMFGNHPLRKQLGKINELIQNEVVRRGELTATSKLENDKKPTTKGF